MTDQTINLCASLPHFAEMFKATDRRGSAQWRIIQWEDITPEHVRPDQIRVISECFSNRTEALTKSQEISRHLGRQRTEKGHWGVWEWQQDGKTIYQSIMPVLDTSNKPTSGTKGTAEASSTMVRMNPISYRILRELAEQDHKPLQTVMEEALKTYQAKRFFDDLDAYYAELRNDPQAWKEELEERALLDNTLMDGMDTDEVWDLETRTATIKGEEKSGG